ncbi:MAG: trigger factor [Ruminococcaceae bacterium]|nr:trigger factor [Oscillospiraceae bacterium]
MKVLKQEKVQGSAYEVEFSIENEAFQNAIQKVYRKEVKNMNVPGFRKGKAPLSIVRKLYGEGVFYEDAINTLIPEVFPSVLEETKLETNYQPEFDIVSIDENGLVLKAKIYVKPEVEIKDYEGLEITVPALADVEAEVERDITAARERNSREVEVTDRAVQNGDIAVIDFEGFLNGVAFEGGKGENHPLEIGSGSFIPGFEEQIVGKNIGDNFDINVTFPAEYGAEELAGKEVVFKIALHAIKSKELPELDDDFAVDVSEFNTFDEYKADLTAKIEKRLTENRDRDISEALLKALAEKVEGDIPEPMFAEEVQHQLESFKANVAQYGFDFETYLKITNMTEENVIETTLRPRAEVMVKSRLALEKIAADNNLSASDEAVESQYEAMATAYKMEVEKLKEIIKREYIEKDCLAEAALDFVKSKAVVKDAE